MALEATDIYGHWKVKTLIHTSPGKVGLTAGSSTFRIKHDKNGNHILETTGNVRWKDKSTTMTEITGGIEHKSGFRLQANVTSIVGKNQDYRVMFGSQDGGATLYFYIEEQSSAHNPARAVRIRTLVGRTHSGSFGTAGRGG